MYEKMVQIDPKAPTEAENRAKAVTKPRYVTLHFMAHIRKITFYILICHSLVSPVICNQSAYYFISTL